MKPSSRMESGATMLIGTFTGLFLVAVLYHVVGVGNGTLENQLTQDGADAVAYSNAAAKARGMNILSLINLVMATVLSVLVAIRLVQVIIGVAIAAVGVACFITGGAACGAIAPLINAEVKLGNLASDLEEPVKQILQGLEQASDVVNETVPVLAQAEAVYISRQNHYGPVEIGFAWPIADALPTQKGEFKTLCEQAGKQVVYATTFFLPGDLPQKAQSILGELVGNLASKFSSFFCGGSGSAPDKLREVEVAYPLREHSECDNVDAKPNPWNGQCQTALCSKCAQLGCTECLKRTDKEGYIDGTWQVQTDVWIDVVYPSGQTSRIIESTNVLSTKTFEGDPCMGTGSCGGENNSGGNNSGSNICKIEKSVPDSTYLPATATQVTTTTYKLLHGCIIKEKVETELQGEPIEADEWPVPREMDKEGLPETLRVRGFVLASSSRNDRIHRVAVSGGDAGGDASSILPNGAIGFAGAEYGSPNMDLWHMNWRSRLIKFRFPSEGMDTTGNCSGVFAAECNSVGARIDQLKNLQEDWILH